MHISRLVVRNFRNFQHLDVRLHPGVTCIVGENNTGKTNLLHAIRLAIDGRLSSYRRTLTPEDFSVGKDFRTPTQVLVSLEFADFAAKANEEAMVLGWHVADDLARITYRFRPLRAIRDAIALKQHPGTHLSIDDYRWEFSGGGDSNPATVDWDEDFGKSVRIEELQQSYLVELMHPLRDVEQSLRQRRNSPLGRLLDPAHIPEDEQRELVELLATANAQISKSATIESVGNEIGSTFHDATGPAFSLGVKVGMVAPTFSDVSRSLTVLLSSNYLKDFDPSRNGLGLNNVLFICMLLRNFERRKLEAKTAGQVLLIEEPEAHLHPQLQRALFGTLREKSFQTIVSTHSSHISSQASLSSVVVLTNDGTPATATTVPAASASLTAEESADLERYLDATRATLLYARSVMLVEGPAELFLIPALVRAVMGIKLEAIPKTA